MPARFDDIKIQIKRSIHRVIIKILKHKAFKVLDARGIKKNRHKLKLSRFLSHPGHSRSAEFTKYTHITIEI